MSEQKNSLTSYKKFKDYIKDKNTKTANYFLDPGKDGVAGFDYDGPLSMKLDKKDDVMVLRHHRDQFKGRMKEELPYDFKSDEGEKSGTVFVAYDDDADKEPLGNLASPGLSKPESPGEKPDVKVKNIKPKKLTSEEFVAVTKDMSQEQFEQFMNEHLNVKVTPVSDLFGNQFTPEPNQTICYVASLILGNPVLMQRFLREVKRRGGLGEMISEAMEMPDTYPEMVKCFEDPEHGFFRCNSLARSMNDAYLSKLENIGIDPEEVMESVGPDLDKLLGDEDFDFGDSQPDQKESPGNQDDFGLDSQPEVQPDSQPEQKPLLKKMKSGGKPKYMGECAGTQLINELAEFPDFMNHMRKRCSS